MEIFVLLLKGVSLNKVTDRKPQKGIDAVTSRVLLDGVVVIRTIDVQYGDG